MDLAQNKGSVFIFSAIAHSPLRLITCLVIYRYAGAMDSGLKSIFQLYYHWQIISR